MSKTFFAGTFDNFHVGHQYLLWMNVQPKLKTVIIVARDTTVLRIKGQLPKNSEQQRLERIRDEGLPNTIVRLGREDADFWAMLREENPDKIVLGYDQRFNVEECKQRFPQIEVVRAQPYRAEIFKSSKFF